MGLEQGLGAPVDAADRDAHALGRDLRVARVGQRQRGGHGGEAARAVHAAGVALPEALARVLALGDREGRDGTDRLDLDDVRAGATARQGVPEGLRPAAERAQDARACDHHPSAHAADTRRGSRGVPGVTFSQPCGTTIMGR